MNWVDILLRCEKRALERRELDAPPARQNHNQNSATDTPQMPIVQFTGNPGFWSVCVCVRECDVVDLNLHVLCTCHINFTSSAICHHHRQCIIEASLALPSLLPSTLYQRCLALLVNICRGSRPKSWKANSPLTPADEQSSI